MQISDVVKAQFWSYVAVSPNSNACWPWLGSLDKRFNYGYFLIPRTPRPKQCQSARLAYEFTHGPIPAQHVVRHLCNNPQCCNPAHLQAGPRESRFLSHIDMSQGLDACWPWQKTRDKKGYGIIKVVINGQRCHTRTHRIMYERTYGPIPEGMLVCHHCDFPPCNNPRHLFLGTVADNVTDMMVKGRHKSFQGEAHGMAKLTDADVFAIRKTRGTMSCDAIAEQYNISKAHAWRLQTGTDAWQHLPLEPVLMPEERLVAKLTADQVREIRRLAASGNYTYKQLGMLFNTNHVNAFNIVKRKSWKHIA